MFDDFHAAEFPVVYEGRNDITSLTFKRGENELMVGAFLPGCLPDGLIEAKIDMKLHGVKAGNAWFIDLMNGMEQELEINVAGGDTIIKGLLIKDFPVYVRVSLGL